MEMLLKLLSEDARLSLEQLASLTGTTEKEVAEKMDEYRRRGIIAGYEAVIDWERAGIDRVLSLIEVKISPKRDFGFDEFADTIARFPEVETVYLMSGGFDLAIMIHGKSFKDIAMFVSKRLSPMESVLSTVLKTYKERGALFIDKIEDERGLGAL